MVFKKPYAFLIKNFKIIHLILTAIMISVIALYRPVSGFFREQLARPFQGVGLADQYISSFLYLALLVIIGFSVLMFWLMKEKGKPFLFYILSTVYYSILLLAVIIAANIMNSLDGEFLTPQNARTYSDVFFLVLLPQFYFLIQALIRGLGFDVKSFNFAKDLNDLEISSEDNEEFEFVLGTDVHKYERKARRYFRELRYYFKENKFVLKIIAGAIVLLVGIYAVSQINFGVIAHRFGRTTLLNGLNIRINDSYITQYDLNGKMIREDSQFIIIHLTITNSSGRVRTLNNTDWYLTVSGTNYFHSAHLRDRFIDIGVAYANTAIPVGETIDTILIFEVPGVDNLRAIDLNILREIETDGRHRYSNFRLRPQNINNIPERVAKSINEEIVLGQNIFKDSTLKITNVEIVSHFRFQREVCRAGNCSVVDDAISPSNPMTHRLMVVEYELNLNPDIELVKTITQDRTFFERHLELEFYFNGRVSTRSETIQTRSGLNNMLFIEISTGVINDQKLNMMINTREKTFYVDLLNLEEAQDA